VFLDRDGVLNRNVLDPTTGEYGAPLAAKDFELAPGALAALLALRRAGFDLFLVSNQPNYAKGKSSLEELAAIHLRLEEELARTGIEFAAFYYCRHHPQGVVSGYSGACECRKPSPYFLLQARDSFALEMAECWMVGDRATDIECGRAAGVRTIRVADDHPSVKLRAAGEIRAEFEARDLAHATEIILGVAASTSASVSDSLPVVAILAGGLATRLGALAASLPKSLLPVGGEPFIAHQLRGLAQQGFRNAVVCAGHLGTMIEDFVGDGSAFGCRVRYSFDGDRPLGTGGALRRALPLLGDGFLVLYGDSYLREPFWPVWRSFADSGKAALMTVFRNEDRWGRSNVEFSHGEVLRYDKTARTPAMRHIDYGLGCIRGEALAAWAAEGERFDLADFYRDLLERGELAGFEVSGRFYEIGSPEGLAETDALLGGGLPGKRGDAG